MNRINARYLIILLITFLLSPGFVAAQQMAKGVVYHDQNQNGRLDRSEKPLPKVAVSNGSDVVLSNKQGRYELPVTDDTIIFVIKPDGYRIPVDNLNRPQFYYIHKPKGSPDLEYSGIAPTGPLPNSIDFGLFKEKQKNQYDILVFGDPQPYNLKEVDYFDRDIVNELVGAKEYEFGISLGDLVGNDLDLFEPYSKSVARVGLPWFNVYGNHDMNFDVDSDSLADETFEATFGPATYSFNKGKVHYIIIDDVIYPRPDGGSGYIGGLTDKQITFIKNDLNYVPKDHLIVLAFHIPIVVPEYLPETTDINSYFLEDNRIRLFNLLSDYPNTLSLSAHTHVQQIQFVTGGGWERETPHVHYNVGTTSGDWWSGEPNEYNIPPTLMRDGTPNGYSIIRFNGNKFFLDYKVAGSDHSKKMNLWGPKVLPQREWFNADLYVNYFMGSDSTKVEYRVKGKDKWTQMGKVELGDPNVTLLRDKWDMSDTLINGKRPNNAIKSSHLWKARIPKNLPEGDHTLIVRVTDMFGREFFDEYHYRIEDR